LKHPNAHLFSYCPRCGEKTLDPVGPKSFLCRKCTFKFYLNCAAAAIALIFTPDNELVVTKRKNAPAKGMLDFPGGFAEPGESIENCIKREVNEELCLDIISATYLFSLPNTYHYADVTYDITDFVFQCRVDHFEKARPGDDVLALYFSDITSLDRNLFGLDSARAVVDRLQAGTVKLNPA